MIRLEQVSKSFDGGATFAVRGVDLEVGEGELVVLLGASGSGKTTTLKTINGLIEPTAGSVVVGGRDVRDQDPIALRRGIGYVFQGIGLFPHRSVAENIAVVPRLLGWSRAEVEARVDDLQTVGLDPSTFRTRLPAELSGGQRQRVGVARALAARPRILLMDEPFGALDPLTRHALQDELRRLQESLRLTTVLVTHDIMEALLLADRIAVLHAGSVLQIGTPHELLAAPRDEQVRAIFAVPRADAARVAALIAGDAER